MPSDRQWYPSILLDEILPEHCDRPEGWLAPDAEGRTEIRFDPEQKEPTAIWAPGEVVSFCFFRHLGQVNIGIAPDGSLTRAHRCGQTPDMFDGAPTVALETGIPDDANWFWSIEESDIGAETIEEFAGHYAETFHFAEPSDALVGMGHWSHDILFTIGADGRSLLPAEPPRPDASARREDKENPC